MLTIKYIPPQLLKDANERTDTALVSCAIGVDWRRHLAGSFDVVVITGTSARLSDDMSKSIFLRMSFALLQ